MKAILRSGFLAVAIMLVGAAYLGAPALSKEFDHEAICDAIHQSQAIHLWYKAGEDQRIVLPRFLGYTKVGNIILNGWQISGFSRSGNLTGSRSFRLDRMTDMQFTNERVSGPKPSGRVPSGMVRMICRVVP